MASNEVDFLSEKAVKPTGEYILVKLLEPEKKSKGGLWLTDDTVPKNQGIVKAISPDLDATTLGFKIGDQVLFAKNMGRSFTMAGKNYVLVMSFDVEAVVYDK